MTRSGDWKLIHYWDGGRDELYNLAEDVGEQKDLAGKNPEKVRELRSPLDRWLSDVGGRIPAPTALVEDANSDGTEIV
jgi:hypothetical protein